MYRLAELRYGAMAYDVHFDRSTDDLKRFRAYGLRRLLCCSLVTVHTSYASQEVRHGGGGGGSGSGSGSPPGRRYRLLGVPRRRLLVLLGLDLGTGEWELVHELEQEQDGKGEEAKIMSAAVELRPDLFLSQDYTCL